MAAFDSNPFEEHYVAKSRRQYSPISIDRAQPVTVQFSSTLEADLAKWRRSGYICIGLSDSVSKAGQTGLSKQLEEQAMRVGAHVVLFCVWPAKLKSVRRDERGEIDLEAVATDPPASFSPRSYAVTRALFLAPSHMAHAQSDASLSQETPCK